MSKAKILIAALDSKARIVSFNDYAQWLTGYTKSEAIGKNWFDLLIHPKDTDMVMEVFNGLFNGEETYWDFVNDIVLKDKTKVEVRWSNAILRDADGKAEYVYSSGTLTKNKF